MSTFVDQLLAAAARNGDLDNPKYKGEPIPIDDDSHIHPELRMTYRILKGAGIAPPEVETMKAIRALQDELATTTDPARQDELTRTILREQSVLKLRMEKIANR